MILHTKKVSDAMSLTALQTDRFKTGVLTFTLYLPLTPEYTARHILLSGMMRRGTQKYPSVAAINRRLDELYATDVEIRSTKLGKNLLFTVTAEMLDPRYVPAEDRLLEGVIEAVAELLLRPLTKNASFDEAALKGEIRIATDALKAEINNTRSYSITRCCEQMNRHDPLYPTVAAVKQHLALTDAKMLYEHYRMLLTASPIDVFYVGSVAPDKVAGLLARAFSDAPAAQKRSLLPLCAATASDATETTEKMPVTQGKLAMGFRTGVCAASEGNAPYVALLLNEIFGGSAASKLFLNVREKMSLCYYCSSSYSIYTGDLMVSSGIEVKNRAVAEAAIREQMEDIRRGNVTEAELYTAKKSLENCYRQLCDNPLELQAFYSARRLFGIDEPIDVCCEKIAAVCLEDIISLARQTVCDTVFFVEGTRVAEDTDTEDADDE